MLGIQTRRTPIQGEFAQKLREQISRMRTGSLTEEDKKLIELQNAERDYEVVWG